MKSHNRAIRQGVAPTPQSYQQLPTPIRLACWSSLGSSAAYCQNKTPPRPTMLLRLGSSSSSSSRSNTVYLTIADVILAFFSVDKWVIGYSSIGNMKRSLQ